MKTKNKILIAARELFSEKGFSGTSISDIAKRAEINQSLIYHHIGNKEELWKEVKQSYLAQENNTLSYPSHDLRSFLNAAVWDRFRLYAYNPSLSRMMLWQRLERETPQLQGGSQAIPEHWVKPIEELQRKGEIEPTFSPHQVALLISSSLSGALDNTHAQFMTGFAQQEAYVTLVIECLWRGLRPLTPNT